MIFLLINTVNDQTIYLLGQKEYTVGRKNCDILLENDQSISREHGIIRIKDDHVTFEDKRSKYHSLHNGVQVDPEIKIVLKHMDLIQFGILNNKFRFESYTFMVAASALSSEKKATLKQALTGCNGKYSDKWTDKCTHLTVDRLTLTVKVLQALIDEKPIVTLDYWNDYAACTANNSPLPDVKNYSNPPVGEQLLRADFEYKIDPQRKTLFENKLFIFLKTSTKKQMEDVIRSCGGRCISWEEETKTLFDIIKSPIEHLLVKTENDEVNVSFDAIVKDLAGKHQKRPIPLNEIALAIIHCSCDLNCNPSFNKISEVFGAKTPNHSSKGILALETQTQNLLPNISVVKTEKYILPSAEDDWLMASSSSSKTLSQQGEASGTKRTSNREDHENVAKKAKLEAQAIGRHEEAEQTSKVDKIAVAQEKPSSKVADVFKDPPQKRKAVEEAETATCLKLNPFSSIKVPSNKKIKVDEEINPFTLARSSKPPKKPVHSINEENPFASIMSVSNWSTPTTKVEEVKPKEEPRREIRLIPKNNISHIPSTKKSFFTTSWLSKSTIKSETTIKEENPEMAKIVAAFKDCVKVEVLTVYERTRSTINISDTSFDSTDGRRNFKKFRKVKPLKPQVTIISRHMFKKIAPGDTTGINVANIDSDEEDGPSNSRTKQAVKPVGKRFVL